MRWCSSGGEEFFGFVSLWPTAARLPGSFVQPSNRQLPDSLRKAPWRRLALGSFVRWSKRARSSRWRDVVMMIDPQGSDMAAGALCGDAVILA